MRARPRGGSTYVPGIPGGATTKEASNDMRNLGRLARVAALSAVAVVAMGGVAGAAAKGNSPAVHGTVTAVDGVSTSGTCGVAGSTGTFTLTATNAATDPPTVKVTTVEVTLATSFVEKKVTSPSFADLCVGNHSVVVGTNVDSTMTAEAVTISPPKPAPRIHLFGSVTAVNGDTTAGTCGTAGASGDFTLSTIVDTSTDVSTVAVDSSTLFTERHLTLATFADVCVGYKAVALGSSSDGTVTATLVAIRIPPVPKPPKPHKPIHVTGIVSSVGGVTTTGTCGTAGDAGVFTVVRTDHATSPPTPVTLTIDVTAGTAFAAKDVASPSFANVCVGGKTVSIGNTVSGALDAVAVAAWAPRS